MNWKGGLALICLALFAIAWMFYPQLGIILVVLVLVGLFVALITGIFKS